MKRLLSLLFVLMFAVVLVACNGTKDTTDTTGTTGSTEPPTSSEPDEEPDDRTVITLAHWGIGTEAENNLWRRRVKRFNETNENIRIEIVTHEGDWNQWLQNKASAGELPDVFIVNSVPDAALAGWARNIYDLVSEDEEWNNIPKALRESITYAEDKVYAVPAAYHYLGYFANLTLIGETGSKAPFHTYDYTLEDFLDVVNRAKDVSGVTDGTGTIGLDASTELINWLPSVYDETGTIKHFVWNGEKFAYNSEAMIKMLEKAAEIFEQKLAFNAFSDAKIDDQPSERETLFGTNDFNQAFATGKMAFRWGATWDAAWYYENTKDSYIVDFIGLPGKRVVGVSDYFVISKATQHPEEAYEVAKYLTFGEQGIEDMFDIIEEAWEEEEVVLTVNGLPLNESEDILNKWFNYYPLPGFKNIYELEKQGKFTVLMEGNKYVPGFSQARWNYDTGIDATISRPDAEEGKTLSIGDLVWDAAQGKIDYSEYMTQELEDKINEALQKQLKQLLGLED